MAKTTKTPGGVLQSFIDEYQINASVLSRDIQIGYQTLLNVITGKQKIAVPTALKLGKYFGNSALFWLNLQLAFDIDKISENKKFASSFKKIQKAKKPTGKAKASAKAGAKAGKRKTKTLAEKRKTAAKTPGARGSKRAGKRRGRPAKK